ncbi:DUF4199 domain-containing protein [Allosphingosinicella sp.]|jgi:uncharacterized membrane protein YhaH (DUF805 family)|uniref:DUF4199 domain-containing protein n=1 Tax=Allosphingosinicella sp. TaxID=2823234 RepID=UPI002EF2F65E
MSRTIRYPLVYGSLAGLIIVAISLLAYASGMVGHSTSPLFGYTVMLLALTMIFVGVKRYRDVELGGVIRFGRALALALGIGLVASIIYAAAFEIYVAVTGFDFTAWYSEVRGKELAESGASQGAIQAELAEIRAFGETYKNPFVRIPFHFLEIGPVVILIALVSAGLLRNPRLLPARAARSA